MKRRTFLRNSLYGGLAASAGLGLYAWQIEPFWLEFVKRPMSIANLPSSLQGKTLMQISDIHVGNRFDYQYLIESLKQARQFQPDFVAYTGDYVSYETEEQFSQLEEVLQHVVKGRLGTVGILGNHDYGHGWRQPDVANRIEQLLSKTGIHLLRNDQVMYAGLNFVGIDDYWAINFHPEHVMPHVNSAKANVVLCHNPDVCDLDVWADYQGWILSGHTHGGQCKPPFLDPPMLPVQNKRYAAGAIDLMDGRHLYINRALGHLWQVRFNVRPEITVFHLAKA